MFEIKILSEVNTASQQEKEVLFCFFSKILSIVERSAEDLSGVIQLKFVWLYQFSAAVPSDALG